MVVMVNNIALKRFLAFIFDFLLISVIVSMFGELKVINPYYDEYINISEEYITYVESIEDVNDIDSNVVNTFVYKISYYSLYNNIIFVVFIVIYYIVFQFFNDGKTIGKALMRIKIASNNGKKVSFFQILIRTLIINGLLFNCINVICLILMSEKSYINIVSLIQLVDMLIFVICVLMILFRKDGKGLHDIVSNSKIVVEKNVTFVDKSVNND